MFISKKNTIKKYSKISVDLLDSFNSNINLKNDKYLTTENLSKKCNNLCFEDGKLKENYGLQELVLPVEQANSDVYLKKISYSNSITLKRVWRYKYYSQINSRYEYILLAYASDNKIYFNNIFSYGLYLSAIGSCTFGEEPTLLSFRVNGADCVGFATSTNDLTVWNCDSVPYAVSNAPKFRSICVHNGKLFAIEDGMNYAIRYSSTVNPTAWTSNDDASGGRIDFNDFRGELRKIISHMDNLYVFRDFGISKISSYASNTQFMASNIYNASTKIYTDTVCVCGEDICFLAEDGLYKFDGYKVTKIDLDIFLMFKKYLQTNAQTCFYNNKLYIACYLNFLSTEPLSIANNSIIVVDLQTQKASLIYDVNVRSFYCLKDLNMSKLVACLNGETNGLKLWELCDGKSSDLTFNKLWESNNFVVTNEHETKNLKDVLIKCNCSLTLTISNESKIKTINVTASNKLQKFAVNLRGKIFSASINSQASEFELTYLKLNFVV